MSNMKSKIKWTSIFLLAIAFILNIKVGCPGFIKSDFNKLLRTMYHEDFPINYKIIKKSETNLYQYLFDKRKCAYEMQITRKDNNNLADKIKGTKFWRNLHPDWNVDPCKKSPQPFCDEDELQHILKLDDRALMCFANFGPRSLVLVLKCYDY